MASATQLTPFLHRCGVVLNISGTVHVCGVVQHAPSRSLGIVAEHQTGAQGLFAVDQQGGCSWGLLQEGVAVCGGEDGLVIGAQGMQCRNLPCRQVTWLAAAGDMDLRTAEGCMRWNSKVAAGGLGCRKRRGRLGWGMLG